VSSRSSGARIDAGTFAPPDELSPWVESLWWGSWDLSGEPDHVTELLGDPAVHVVFEVGDAAGPAGEARVVGVWSKLWERRLSGRGEVRGLKLRPGAARTLLPCDAREVTDRRVPLSELFTTSPTLWPRVMEHPRRDGLLHLAHWAGRRLQPSEEAEVCVALVQHVRTSGLLRVEELADHAGRSVRWLQRRFRRHVGLAPKAVIRRHRLQEVALQVERGEAPSLADLAYRLGYADQAHLARDFRSVTGLTLRRFEQRL